MKNADYANRGKSLEDLINYANQQYLAKGVALVQKIPTPWTVIRRGIQIVSAFPAQKSTVDYIGVTNFTHAPVPVAFDVKQCKYKTNFPLSNLEQHQLDFLTAWKDQGGTVFLLIEMTALGKIYKVEINVMEWYWQESLSGGPKSIPVKDFDKFQVLGQAGGIVLDYLGVYS